MSLDIVHPKDIPRGKVPYLKDEDRSMKTNDIQGGRPTYKSLRYLQKPDLSVGCTDTEHPGGQARTYYPGMDRRPRDLSLTTADIEYAQAKREKKGNRHVDPVAPNYELPSCHARPATPNRFSGRHTNDISDIEKSCSKVRIPDRNYARDPNDASDIEYASANYHERNVRRPPRDQDRSRSHNVRDITDTKKVHSRCSNPLDPVYTVPTSGVTSLPAEYTEEMGRIQRAPNTGDKIGFVQGSKPRKLHWDNGEPHFSLLREDIAGTVPQRWVGATPFNVYDHPDVKPVISFHDPHDIPGAQVGTLRKGLDGNKRFTNPLQPQYEMLDGDSRPQPAPVIDSERGHPSVNSRYQMGHNGRPEPAPHAEDSRLHSQNARLQSGVQEARIYGSDAGYQSQQHPLQRSRPVGGASLPDLHSQQGAPTPSSGRPGSAQRCRPMQDANPSYRGSDAGRDTRPPAIDLPSRDYSQSMGNPGGTRFAQQTPTGGSQHAPSSRRSLGSSCGSQQASGRAAGGGRPPPHSQQLRPSHEAQHASYGVPQGIYEEVPYQEGLQGNYGEPQENYGVGAYSAAADRTQPRGAIPYQQGGAYEGSAGGSARMDYY